MEKKVKIFHIEPVTHNVKRFRFEKPEGYTFEPGQATEVSIDKEGWRDANHPFTFTSLNDHDFLEFTIKIYPEHNGFTEQVSKLSEGDHFIIHEPWGTVQYKGPGYFIAGGAGITPFIAILRQLDINSELEGNALIFSNKTSKDIILRDEFDAMKGLHCIYTLTEEDNPDLHHGMINREFLEKVITDRKKNFYVCGPQPMVKDISKMLEEMGAETDSIVFEE